MQLFNPYGHDNLFTVLQHNNDEEWKEVRKAFSKSMSMERIRCPLLGTILVPSPIII